MSDKEDYDSDDSLNTEELNELQQAIPETFGGIERSSKKEPKKQKQLKEPKLKPRPLPEAEEMPEPESTHEPQPEPESNPEPEKPVKKGRGRPKKDPNEPPKEVETRGRPRKALIETLPKRRDPAEGRPKIVEKIVYCIPDFKGGYERVKVKPLTKKQLERVERECEIDEEEIKQKTKFTRTVDGHKDKRQVKTRSQAQIDATRRMVEARKKALVDKKAQKDSDKEKQVKEQKTIIKESIEEAVVETVSKPIDEVRADVQERRRKREARMVNRQKVKTDDALSRARNLFC